MLLTLLIYLLIELLTGGKGSVSTFSNITISPSKYVVPTSNFSNLGKLTIPVDSGPVP